MRGTLGGALIAAAAIGLIPAHAGNTLIAPWPVGFGGAHPRACGEHDPRPWIKITTEGSSPRMRGTLLGLACWLRAAGLIPAHAGNTGHSGSKRGFTGAHPRACGEHGVDEARAALKKGSSPRMRGTLSQVGGFLSDTGLIPAHAGNT